MSWAASIITILLLISITSSVLLGVGTYLSPRKEGWHNFFIFLLICVFVWCVGTLLELASTTFEIKLFWLKIQYFGISFTPVAFFLFAVHFSRVSRNIFTPRLRLLIFVFPLITCLLAFSNEFHNLIWESAIIQQKTGLSPLLLTRGAWFWAHGAYSY